MIVADSDVLIDALRGQQPARERVAAEIRSATLGTTTVNLFELLSGAKTASGRKKVEQLLDALLILPLDDRAARAAAEIRTKLEAKGTGIGLGDYLIAGICVSNDVPLLTRNRSHFERVPGLALGRF